MLRLTLALALSSLVGGTAVAQDWDATLAEARGQTVYWNAWRGDEQINDYLDQRTVVQEQDLLDARIGWRSADERWEVALWGKNLTDEEYIAHSYVIGPGVIGIFGPPATYGVTFSYNWN